MACSKRGHDGNNGHNGSSCSVQSAVNGAFILCTDGTSAIITNGSNGLDGAIGSTGATGETGPTGQTGADGQIGATGSQGPTGNDGATGSIGATGQTGATGNTGATGSQGSAGVNGLPGMDGRDGIDAIVQVVDPCGDNSGQFDEILLRLSTGELLAYFESGGNRFLSLIGPGNYRTTDSQQCYFTVHSDRSISW